MRISQSVTAAVIATCLISLARPASAQIQRGTIYGTAYDGTGAVLPGVVLRLTSNLTAPQETTTGDRGEFRFPDLDPGQYTVNASLQGFAPFVRDNLLVGVGTSIEITIEMAIAEVSEEVIVSAATPVLDVRRQGNVTNFDQVVLKEIPTARDPWALMQHLPGVSIGRPNVGGSESTNQAQFAARGDNGSNTMWNIDGVTITDMAAGGSSITYFDFNVFEEVQFTTGSLDSRQQTGGLGINLVTKRGTNDLHGSGRLYFSNDNLQGENISAGLKAAGLSGNRIRQLAEYGTDVGGRLRKDRLWFWIAAARTDVRQLAINGFPDNSIVNTAAARGDARAAPVTRLSFLYHRAEKLKNGRGAGISRPPETTWNQGGPANIYKAEITHVFGSSLFGSAKFAYIDAGFFLTPQSGLAGQAYLDFAAQVWHGGFAYSSSERRQYQTQIDGNWSRGRHEAKFGFQHRRTASSDLFGWPGDGTFTLVNLERIGLPAGVGLARLTRPGAPASATGTTSVYVGDVIAAGRWTFDLGVRFDRQRGRNTAARVASNGLAPSLLPALEYGGGPYITWNDWSPRAGAALRVTDKTVVRASYARFASQLSSLLVGFDNGAQQATIEYRFRDANGNRLAEISELLNPTGSVSAVNPADPAAPYSPNLVDRGLTSPATHVFVCGVERELMGDFSLGVSFGQGHATNTIWDPFIGLTREHFVQYRSAGATGGISSSTPVYRLAPGASLPPGNGLALTNRDGYHQRYWNIDLLGTKRLSNRWMFRGVLTLQQEREFFDEPEQAIQDPTPRFGTAVSGFLDGGIAANVHPAYFDPFLIHARWLYSLAGLYELPWGMSAAGTIYGRQGYPVGETVTVDRPDGLGLTPVLIDPDLDATRYRSLHLLDLRLQKRLTAGRVRATLNLDVFNALNTAVILRRFREATATTFRNPQEIVAPRLVRLGLHLQF